MDLMKHTKAELAEIIRQRNAELEAARLALAEAQGTVNALRSKLTKPSAQPGVTRYWDEFESRGEALTWAKANPLSAVKQRPVQRAES